MVSYHIDGPILTLVGDAHASPEARRRLLESVRTDLRVPDGALILVDARQSETDLDQTARRARFTALADRLGPKLGPACAVLVTGSQAGWARLMKPIGRDLGLRIAVFMNEEAAREWLRNDIVGLPPMVH